MAEQLLALREEALMAWKHGTAYGYDDKGCRCSACRTAKMQKRRMERAKARAENRPSYRRELAASRALKERYRGTCKLCGAPTTGCNGKDAAPDICVHCSPGYYGPRYAAARRGRGPVVERALALLDTPHRFSEIRDELGITNGHTGQMLDRLLRYGLVERLDRGVYRRTEQREAAA
jgi:hypothetical protein